MNIALLDKDPNNYENNYEKTEIQLKIDEDILLSLRSKSKNLLFIQESETRKWIKQTVEFFVKLVFSSQMNYLRSVVMYKDFFLW